MRTGYEFMCYSIQLSVTIGIMLAYLLGLFVQWRPLAVIGTLNSYVTRVISLLACFLVALFLAGINPKR